MAERNKAKEQQLMDNPVEFMMDLLIDMVKAFKEGLMGKTPEAPSPEMQMKDLQQGMMQLFQGMQQMQMQHMQMQMQQMNGPQPQQMNGPGNKGPVNQQSQPNMQMPNMQMPNMQMLNMQMPNMQMPNMQMPNMQMPNMMGQNMTPQNMIMNVFMQMTQMMMSGMMQYMQQMQVQNQQQMQQAPEKQQQTPMKEETAPEKPVEKEAENEGPAPVDPEKELIDSTQELKEANNEYKAAKQENDALRAEFEKEVTADEKAINRAQAEMDRNIDAIARLKAEKDTTLDQDRQEFNKEVDASEKESVISATERTKLAFEEEVDTDAVHWDEKSLTDAEVGIEGLNTDNMGEDVRKSAGDYAAAIRSFNDKQMDGSVRAEDTIKTYDAAKRFLDSTQPKAGEKLSPSMQKARAGAQNLVRSLDGMKEAKIRDVVEDRAAAAKSGQQYNPSAKNIKWFSKGELDKAINSFDKMREQNGTLSPGAEKFQSALKDLRNGLGKSEKGLDADAYVKAYNAADDFMKESLSSGKSGPEIDAARQAAKDVRKRLNENNRIEKLKTIDAFEKKQQMLREKAAKLNEREQAQARREQKIDKLKNNMRSARSERDKLNTEKHKENKKKLEESNKRLKEATAKREAAKNRRRNAENKTTRRSQPQKQAPQKKVMGM